MTPVQLRHTRSTTPKHSFIHVQNPRTSDSGYAGYWEKSGRILGKNPAGYLIRCTTNLQTRTIDFYSPLARFFFYLYHPNVRPHASGFDLHAPDFDIYAPDFDAYAPDFDPHVLHYDSYV